MKSELKDMTNNIIIVCVFVCPRSVFTRETRRIAGYFYLAACPASCELIKVKVNDIYFSLYTRVAEQTEWDGEHVTDMRLSAN